MTRQRRHSRRGILTITGVLMLGVVLVEYLFADSPQVRIDSGDRRRGGFLLCFPEDGIQGREHLVAASKELGIPARWCRATRRAPSYPDAGRYFLYARTAFWLQAEPALGKRILSDVADYFCHQAENDGYPPSTIFLFALTWNDQTHAFEFRRDCFIPPDHLQAELANIGYTPVRDGVLASVLQQLSSAP
jgi:hypothetical protein